MIYRFLLSDGVAYSIENKPPLCTGNVRINDQIVDVWEVYMGEYEGDEYRFWVGKPIMKELPEGHK